MFKFFQGIASIIDTVVNYVVSFFTNLAVVLLRSIQALAYVLEVIALLPMYVKVYILAMIGVSAILFVLNKGD